MRVLVTGGAGFIGSHLSEALVDRGDSVTVLDDLSTGSEDNVAALSGNPMFELVRGSVLDRNIVDDLIGSCDAVVHLASPVGVRLIVERPLQSIRTIIDGTQLVLDAAAKRRTKVLIASTSEVYGKNTGVLHEDADRLCGPTTVPRWSYSAAKAIDEFLAFGYWQELGVPTVVLRFFNTVGPRQIGSYGMVLPRFVARALLGEDLPVYGDGQQRRCFCHVADAVRAVTGLLDTPDAVGRAFNIASEEEVRILELAHRVIDLTGSASRVQMLPFESVYGQHFEDMERRRPDTARIRQLLGWMPRARLDTTIKDVVAEALRVGPQELLTRGR